MLRSIARRTSLVCLVVCQLATTLLVTAPAARAQSVDSVSPRIAFEPLGETRRGARQVFSATVTDEVGVERVVLHHRAAGTDRYTPVPMTPLGDTGIYTVSIEDPGDAVEAIEFYIEARDEAGNRSIEGFAFDPLERRLVAPSPLAERGASEPAQAPSADGMSTRRKIVYGVLGVIAIGALAAAAGGGDGGGGGDLPRGDDPGDVTVTIVADPLP